MLELFGQVLGTPLQGGIFGVLLASFVLALRTYLIKRPDMTRAENEGRVIHNSELARQYHEWRKEVHSLKNDIAMLIAQQSASDTKVAELESLLNQSLSTSSMRRQQMTGMMSLIELLITELERIDGKSIIVPQARALLKQMRDTAASDDPSKSHALNTAEHAVLDAKQTLASTRATREEVKKEEGK